MSVSAGQPQQAARRKANVRVAGAKAPAVDAQGLVEFACECLADDCERSVRVPLYVYRRVLDTDDQFLVHRGHHPYPRYRTIVTRGSMSIEQIVTDADGG